MKTKSGEFLARGNNGRTVAVIEWTSSDGPKRLTTQEGKQVNLVKEGVYRIVATGEILWRSANKKPGWDFASSK
jgi:hypothetical protein